MIIDILPLLAPSLKKPIRDSVREQTLSASVEVPLSPDLNVVLWNYSCGDSEVSH